MRWLTFFLLAIGALTLQSAVGNLLTAAGARPDLLLIVVVFIALHAPEQDAVCGAGLIGLSGDLLSVERLGLLALSYVLAAMVIVAVREYVFKRAHATRFILTLVVGLMLHSGWTVYRLVLYESVGWVGWEQFWQIGWAAIYTACCAVPLHGIFSRLSPLFGFVRPKYSYAGGHRGGGGRV